MGLKEIVLGFLYGSGEPIARTVRCDPTLPSGSPLADKVRKSVKTELAVREEISRRYAETQSQIVNERAETKRKQREEQQRKIDALRNELQETFSRFKIMELMRDLRNNVWKGGDLSPEPIFARDAYKGHNLPTNENRLLSDRNIASELFARLSITYRGAIIDLSGHVPAEGGGYSIGEVNHGPGVCLTGLDVGILAFNEIGRGLFVRTISHPVGSVYPGDNGRQQISEIMLVGKSLAKIPLNGEEDPDSIINQLHEVVTKDATSRYLSGFLPSSRLAEKGKEEIREFERKKKEYYRH